MGGVRCRSVHYRLRSNGSIRICIQSKGIYGTYKGELFDFQGPQTPLIDAFYASKFPRKEHYIRKALKKCLQFPHRYCIISRCDAAKQCCIIADSLIATVRIRYGEMAEFGLRRTTGNRVYGEPYQGFESLSLRQTSTVILIQNCGAVSSFVPDVALYKGCVL